jgi:hypothetical protein
MDIRAGYYVDGRRVSGTPAQAQARARYLASLYGRAVDVLIRTDHDMPPILAYTAIPQKDPMPCATS